MYKKDGRTAPMKALGLKKGMMSDFERKDMLADKKAGVKENSKQDKQMDRKAMKKGGK